MAVLMLGAGISLGAGDGSPGRGPGGSTVPQSSQLCTGDYPAYRDPSNPLMLAHAPGSNPLNGAQFFVDGPAHGAAAGAIARLLGRDPSDYPDDYSWQQFANDLSTGPLAARLAGDPGLRHKVMLLEKIAREPEEQRFSLYSGGGGPGAILGQVHKILCNNLSADPTAIPIFTTFFLYQAGYCETKAQILQYRGRFERQIDELAEGIGRRPAVLLLELDAIGSSSCMQRNGALGEWEADIRYEINRVSALPHTVVYIEGGYSDSNDVTYTARALNAVGVGKIQGFFTNDTHNAWTIKEIRWAEAISRRTGGAHIIVNTATNGRGPLLNPHPVTQGVEDLCNAPGRGIGPRPTTDTGFKNVDAFLWTGPPGNSSGSCHGGTAAGTFWPARALDLAGRAQGKLGPGYPADPY
ncbi:MAG: glycoside hydrolase family 6 protein [Solirubrobacteraceae bacterium]